MKVSSTPQYNPNFGMTASEKLLHYIKTKRIVPTSGVLAWGVNNHSNRADRNARALAERGLIRRMTDDEKQQHGYGLSVEDVWVSKDFPFDTGKQATMEFKLLKASDIQW